MNLNTLKYLICVADFPSLSQAAIKMHISQQGLSNSIASMENELGVRIIERTPHGIMLTKQGRRVLQFAHSVIDDVDMLIADLGKMQDVREILNGSGINLTVSGLGLMTLIKAMRELGHLKDIHLVQAETDIALQMVNDPKWLALVDLPDNLYSIESMAEEYQFIPFSKSKIGVVSLPSSVGSIPTDEKLSIEEVARMPLGVASTSTTNGMFEAIFKETPLENVHIYTSAAHELMHGVSEGHYSALTVSDHWEIFKKEESNSSRFTFHLLDTPVTIYTAFIHSKSVSMTLRQEEFAQECIAVFNRGNFSGSRTEDL